MKNRHRDESSIDRRQFLRAATGAAAALTIGGLAKAADPPAPAPKPARLGIVTYAMGIHQAASKKSGLKPDLADPLALLQECQRFGAGGMQTSLGTHDADYIEQLRAFAEKNGLFIEANIDLLGARTDMARVEQHIATAKECGATVARAVVMPGRRYEYFNTAEEYAAAAKHALEVLQQVEPIAKRQRFRIAVENHKCHRIPERLDVMKKLGSEYIGICVDVGNSFSLCEDPTEVVRAYAPYAMAVHLKDQAVREYEEGFLYGDAILGQGFLDLPAMVQILRQAKPDINFGLELITRDPLKAPVLTSKYWATMGGVSATELARTLATVKAKSAPQPLATVTDLPPEKQLDAESRNVAQSLAYAHERLQL